MTSMYPSSLIEVAMIPATPVHDPHSTQTALLLFLKSQINFNPSSFLISAEEKKHRRPRHSKRLLLLHPNLAPVVTLLRASRLPFR